MVGVLSAMGDTPDELIDLAQQVSERPKPRALDMLISVGERISCAPIEMAIEDLDHREISLTGRRPRASGAPAPPRPGVPLPSPDQEPAPGRDRRRSAAADDRPTENTTPACAAPLPRRPQGRRHPDRRRTLPRPQPPLDRPAVFRPRRRAISKPTWLLPRWSRSIHLPHLVRPRCCTCT